MISAAAELPTYLHSINGDLQDASHEWLEEAFPALKRGDLEQVRWSLIQIGEKAARVAKRCEEVLNEPLAREVEPAG